MTTSRRCDHCGRSWHNIPPHVLELYHYCSAGPRDNRPRRRPTRDQENRDWASSIIGDAITEAIDNDDDLLRRL